MKRTELYRELTDLANSLDEHVTPAEVAWKLRDLASTLFNLAEFESEDAEPLEQWEIELLTAPQPIVAGDVVRLTGKDWAEWDLLGEIVTVASVSPWGEPEFYNEAEPFTIFKNKHHDYSAEKVNS